jgi:hypothetical protein
MNEPQRVLVCGGRHFDHHWLIDKVLDDLHRTKPIGVLIHGGASGADFWAKQWAVKNNISSEEYPADWKREGRAAGPIRNARMLAEGKPDLVVAFPGNRGTASMCKLAHEQKVLVLRVINPGKQGNQSE